MCEQWIAEAKNKPTKHKNSDRPWCVTFRAHLDICISFSSLRIWLPVTESLGSSEAGNRRRTRWACPMPRLMEADAACKIIDEMIGKDDGQ